VKIALSLSLALCTFLTSPTWAKDSKESDSKKDATTEAAKKSKKDAKKGKEVFAIFETNQGTFKAKLFPEQSPKTVENFVGLAEGKKKWKDPRTGKESEKPLYNGTIFHRVIKNFMIQGGDPTGTGTGDPGYEFANENDPSLKFDKVGLLAMANHGRDTNGCQFFVTVDVPHTEHLTGGYTIFGEVVSGYDVVEKISKVPTLPGDKPKEDVVLKTVKIETK